MRPDALSDLLPTLLPTHAPFGTPVPLPGGLLNHVWRVPTTRGPVVVKHAPPHIASQPEVPLDPSRLTFEARALALFAPEAPLAALATPSLRPPRRLAFDAARHVLVMEDVQPTGALGEALDEPAATPARWGAALGRFLGALHRTTQGDEALRERFWNEPVQDTRYNVQYIAITDILTRCGIPAAATLGASARALGRRLRTPGGCLVMGDAWLPSFLVTRGGALRCIDWEFCTFGHPLQDVAHLEAHLWMHAHRGRAADAVNALRTAFRAAYVETLCDARAALWTPADYAAAGVHFGAELLVRAAGPFQAGFLYDGCDLLHPAVQSAVDRAVRALRAPVDPAIAWLSARR
ncbi:phosphotransferase family protein [Salisaeta longa]|uniref:phosphotransferase family protein n=1 Tax=Salisaeta longa TaxID=503170 RepID=UPI0003B54BC8|nr:aminoglycoside phosphotransferase family protein [Salisaeta longa]